MPWLPLQEMNKQTIVVSEASTAARKLDPGSPESKALTKTQQAGLWGAGRVKDSIQDIVYGDIRYCIWGTSEDLLAWFVTGDPTCGAEKEARPNPELHVSPQAEKTAMAADAGLILLLQLQVWGRVEVGQKERKEQRWRCRECVFKACTVLWKVL